MSHEEPKVVAALIDLCKAREVQLLIQVGAEDGYEAAMVQNATQCRAIAIEGNPALISCSPWIDYHHMIIGATNGITTFYIHKDTGLSGHFPRGQGEMKIEAPQQRLDTFCSIRGIQPDGLIIDTEGSTMEVLEGCDLLLANVNVVYAEVQLEEIRPGIRLIGEVDKLLSTFGLTQHQAMPSYGAGGQMNMTWVR